MKKIITKMLVVTAITGIFSPLAVAGTTTVTRQTHSVEGLVGVTASQTSNSISYTLGDNYSVGDEITFTFPVGALTPQNFPPNISSANLDLTLVSNDGSSILYQVDTVTGNSSGDVIALGQATINSTFLSSNRITVTVSSQHLGAAFDAAGTRSSTVAEAKSQFGTVSINPTFDNTIANDNENDPDGGTFFASADDTITFSVTNPAITGWLNIATVNSTQVTLSGEAGKMAGFSASNFSTAGTKTLTENEAKLDISYTGLITTDTITFTPDTAPLLAQTFKMDVIYNYQSAGAVSGSKKVGNQVTAGAWTLSYPNVANASVVFNHHSNTFNGAYCDIDNVFDAGETSMLTVTLPDADWGSVSSIIATVESAADITFANEGIINFVDGTLSAGLEMTLNTAGTNEQIDIVVSFTSNDANLALPQPITSTMKVNFDYEGATPTVVADSGECVNRKPVLGDVTGSGSIVERAEVTLTAQAIDHDFDNLTYTWLQTAGKTLDVDSTSATLIFNAPAVENNETYTFSVIANDGHLSSDAKEVSFTVTPSNSGGGSMGLFSLLLLPLCFLRRKKR
ncbi:hypothetical protein Ping_0044 [Psychromonas ingrahamii 37]|uniref:Ig-like domain-containing protein n=1 Tax=Psychromonas ingrahamii (strain DSM 17664 / CCUG 51855 / 37) TaxID=357804 RepID=A1SR03_PSYIN|nr:GlyGly-CTERM sorting domain-containing protein [Psychromonas ingrahamii]ABM01918.1 hypothetical protein Ping_0044 [Psychromonas ingrahamii 37]